MKNKQLTNKNINPVFQWKSIIKDGFPTKEYFNNEIRKLFLVFPCEKDIEKIRTDLYSLTEKNNQFPSKIVTHWMELPDINDERWIDVNEKMPPEDGFYLVYQNPLKNNAYPVRVSVFHKNINLFLDYSNITHWMFLPEKPE